MEIVIPTSFNFNYEECKKLFYDNQNLLEDFGDFDDIIKQTFFYSFFVNGVILGVFTIMRLTASYMLMPLHTEKHI